MTKSKEAIEREIEDADKPFEWVHIKNRDELEQFFISILPKIREAAKKCGYAIGVHGSLRRDLDLIATPWIEEHTDKDSLANSIMKAACGLERSEHKWEAKPLGRMATCFPICWTGWHNPDESQILSNGHIDLSVVNAAATEFTKRTEERVCRELIEFMKSKSSNWPQDLEAECIRLGYLKDEKGGGDDGK